MREMGKIDLTLTEGRFVNLGGVDARETHVHEKPSHFTVNLNGGRGLSDFER